MKISKKFITLFLASVMVLTAAFTASAAPISNAPSVQSSISSSKSSHLVKVSLNGKINTPSFIKKLSKDKQKASSNNLIQPEITYGGNIYFSELIAYPCTEVDGEWYYDDSVYTTETFGHAQGYTTSNDYTNCLIYIYTFEDGNFTARNATYNSTSIPSEDMAIEQTDYSGSQVVDRYVLTSIPEVISDGSFEYVGYYSNSNVANWITIK